jgi:hypothetical protein
LDGKKRRFGCDARWRRQRAETVRKRHDDYALVNKDGWSDCCGGSAEFGAPPIKVGSQRP